MTKDRTVVGDSGQVFEMYYPHTGNMGTRNWETYVPEMIRDLTFILLLLTWVAVASVRAATAQAASWGPLGRCTWR